MIYIPVLSNFFGLYAVPPIIAVSGAWMIPVIFIYDETRKFFIRKNLKGFVARMTMF